MAQGVYGYQLLLRSPCGTHNEMLRILSRAHHSSVHELLRAEDLMRDYGSWTRVRFQCAYAESPRSRPRQLQLTVAPPGSPISTAV
jgi:hypothetical protein